MGAGYIYVEPERMLNIVDANIIGVRHGETTKVRTQFDVVIDTDHFGRLMGLEILAPGALPSALTRVT